MGVAKTTERKDAGTARGRVGCLVYMIASYGINGLIICWRADYWWHQRDVDWSIGGSTQEEGFHFFLALQWIISPISLPFYLLCFVLYYIGVAMCRFGELLAG